MKARISKRFAIPSPWRGPGSAWLKIAALGLGLAAWAAGAADSDSERASAAAPAGDEWREFSIVVERNIFDPARGPREQPRPVATPAPPPPPAVTLDLRGAIAIGEYRVAFFEGSALPGPRRAELGSEVAGLRIEDISVESVRLADGMTTATLRVGERLSKRGDEPWQLAGRAAPGERPASSSASAGGSPPPSGASASGGGAPAASGADDSNLSPLERLRLRRQSELGQ